MSELFPRKQVMGFVFSLVLTASCIDCLFLGFVICGRDDDPFGHGIHTSGSSTCRIHACW